MYTSNSIQSSVPSSPSTIMFRQHNNNININNNHQDSLSSEFPTIVGPSDHYAVHPQFNQFTNSNHRPSNGSNSSSNNLSLSNNHNNNIINSNPTTPTLTHHLHDSNSNHNLNYQYFNYNNIANTLNTDQTYNLLSYNLTQSPHNSPPILSSSNTSTTNTTTTNATTKQVSENLLQQNRQQYKQNKMTNGNSSQSETKILVCFNSSTPVIFTLPLPIDQVTLGDLKQALPSIDQPGYKYFFRANDSEFGILKEEIQDDHCRLPISGNRIVAWILTPNGFEDELTPKGGPRSETTTFDQTYSTTTHSHDDGSSSLITGTDIESTSYITETEDCYSRSNYSDESSSSSASQSDATAVRCITVHLVLTNQNFLGLHICEGLDEGIYVANISKNSAIDEDGRIERGDKLIQINDTSLEELRFDEAIEVLKDAVIQRGAIKFVVAKRIDDIEELSRPRDAIHPIDTAAWVAHAQANSHMEHANSTTSSPSFGSNAHDTDCIRPSSVGVNNFSSTLRLNKGTDIKEMIQHMKLPNYGLDIRDREWLKIKIPDAFLGSHLVNWLERNVYGFSNSREAKKFAAKMLKEGFIRDPISDKSFSAKSYYTFVS